MLRQFCPILLRWFPAFVMMTAIFLFSSLPSNELPSLGVIDFIVKKGGHVLGYGLLALSFLRGLKSRETKIFCLSWFLAILYALTDEYHQSFVMGRHPTIWDVIIFDNFGAALALYVLYRRRDNENTKA